VGRFDLIQSGVYHREMDLVAAARVDRSAFSVTSLHDEAEWRFGLHSLMTEAGIGLSESTPASWIAPNVGSRIGNSGHITVNL
jgi:hypothetical protein